MSTPAKVTYISFSLLSSIYFHRWNTRIKEIAFINKTSGEVKYSLGELHQVLRFAKLGLYVGR